METIWEYNRAKFRNPQNMAPYMTAIELRSVTEVSMLQLEKPANEGHWSWNFVDARFWSFTVNDLSHLPVHQHSIDEYEVRLSEISIRSSLQHQKILQILQTNCFPPKDMTDLVNLTEERTHLENVPFLIILIDSGMEISF